jgi:hypothetical protein
LTLRFCTLGARLCLAFRALAFTSAPTRLSLRWHALTTLPVGASLPALGVGER